MGRRRRHFEPEAIYFVTNRCAGGRFLLTPTPEVNGIIRGALAKYARKWDVELFGWLFMSNHFHLMPRSQSLQIPQFMRDFQKKVSSEVKKVTGWDLSVFPKRYHCEKICDEGAVRQKMRYMLLNPVRAGLVRKAEDWPGVSSWGCHASGEPMKGRNLERELWREMKRQSEDGQVARSKAKVTYWLQPAKLPWAEEVGDAEAGRQVVEAVEEVQDEWGKAAVDEARLSGEEVLGAEGVRKQDPMRQPANFEPRPEPLCHAADPAAREAYRSRYRMVMERYDVAIEQWQEDERVEVGFPGGTWPPGWVEAKPYGGEGNGGDGGGGRAWIDERRGAPLLDVVATGDFVEDVEFWGEDKREMVGVSGGQKGAERRADEARGDPDEES